MLPIEKNIPIPSNKVTRREDDDYKDLPLAALEVGDSFVWETKSLRRVRLYTREKFKIDIVCKHLEGNPGQLQKYRIWRIK
jgi:hypothetical protein